MRAIFLIFFGGLIIFALNSCHATYAEPGENDRILAIKLYTGEAGIYEVTLDEIRALGLVSSQNELKQLRLYNRGRKQQLWVDDDQKVLRFYAEKSDSAYSRENIYWLTFRDIRNLSLQDAGVAHADRISVREATELALQDGFYLASLHLEENTIYQPQVEAGGEHWFWKTFPGTQSLNASFKIDKLGNGQGKLIIKIWSNTEAGISPDHHLRVAINNRKVIDESWDGKGFHTLQGEFDDGVLYEGENEIVIEAPGDLDILADLYFVDWLEIYYPRQPVADTDRLEFIQPGSTLQLRGFSGLVSIYEIDSSTQANLAGSDVRSEDFNFLPGLHYIVVGANGYLRPQRMASYRPHPILGVPNNGAEYLAIGPEELLEPLNPLLELRADRGIRTLAVPIEALYDHYTSGFPEPEAIIEFVRNAYQTWEVKPAYLLLVGDSSYDPKSFRAGKTANQMPAYFIDTLFGGETVTDVEFGQLNEDPWPDIAIGILPARNPEHVRAIVEKTLNYENYRGESDRTLKVVAVADGQEPSFSSEAQKFLDLFPDDVDEELFAPQPGDTSAVEQIRAYFEADLDILAYFGHGGVNMWGKDRLFASEDVSRLKNNEKPLIVVNMTCLTGLYTHPQVESLSEALLWRENGGAVAVLAPTSLTLPSDQSFLSDALVEVLMDEKDHSLGQVHLKARRGIKLDSDGARDVMKTFILFGDPALELHFKN